MITRALAASLCLVLACTGEDGVLSAYTDPDATGPEPAATSTGEPTTGEPTTGEPTTGEPAATTDATSPACAEDSDCALVDDCCACAAIHASEAPATCDAACEQTVCTAEGMAEARAVCWDGECVVAILNCLAPPCEPP